MIPITHERAPHVPAGMLSLANTLARSGEIALVGRAAPFNERSLSHNERIMPNAFGAKPVPPPLLAEHTTKTRDGGDPVVMATGILAENTTSPLSLDMYGTGGGLECLWTLNHDLASVDWLFEHLGECTNGLSVEMRVYDDERVWESWKLPGVRHVKDASVHAVAVVPTPAYMTAYFSAIVTPDVSWHMHRSAGVLVPDVDRTMMSTVKRFEYQRARTRAEQHAETVANLPIPAPEAVAADTRESLYGRALPALELR